MLLSYKYRIEPSRAQAAALSEMLADFCSLYNAGLEQRIDAWRRAAQGGTFDWLYFDVEDDVPLTALASEDCGRGFAGQLAVILYESALGYSGMGRLGRGGDNLQLSWRRPITDYSKVQSLIGSAVRNRRSFARRHANARYVNLGCGPNNRAGFLNVDYLWRPNIDLCWDVTKGLPLSDRQCDGIFTEHMLEHIEFNEAKRVLAECRRVLKPGGVLRVIVPDGEIYLNAYAKLRQGEPADMPYRDHHLAENPRATAIYSVNRLFCYHGHRFIWDAEAMSEALREAGFADVKRRAFMEGDDPVLLLDSEHRAAESLYMEAHG